MKGPIAVGEKAVKRRRKLKAKRAKTITVNCVSYGINFCQQKWNISAEYHLGAPSDASLLITIYG